MRLVITYDKEDTKKFLVAAMAMVLLIGFTSWIFVQAERDRCNNMILYNLEVDSEPQDAVFKDYSMQYPRQEEVTIG
jgi:hypothetical protein